MIAAIVLYACAAVLAASGAANRQPLNALAAVALFAAATVKLVAAA